MFVASCCKKHGGRPLGRPLELFLALHNSGLGGHEHRRRCLEHHGSPAFHGRILRRRFFLGRWLLRRLLLGRRRRAGRIDGGVIRCFLCCPPRDTATRFPVSAVLDGRRRPRPLDLWSPPVRPSHWRREGVAPLCPLDRGCRAAARAQHPRGASRCSASCSLVLILILQLVLLRQLHHPCLPLSPQLVLLVFLIFLILLGILVLSPHHAPAARRGGGQGGGGGAGAVPALRAPNPAALHAAAAADRLRAAQERCAARAVPVPGRQLQSVAGVSRTGGEERAGEPRTDGQAERRARRRHVSQHPDAAQRGHGGRDDAGVRGVQGAQHKVLCLHDDARAQP